MISVDEALTRLLALVDTLPPEQIALADGLGRVLAEDVAARRTQPPFAVSAMDGYAVRAADLGRVPVELRIVAEVPAGAGFGGRVGDGEAARIFTGAPMPAGADTVVIQEDTERRRRSRARSSKRAPGPVCAPRRTRLRRRRRAAARRPAADRARYRPARGDEPAVAVRASPAADRHPVDRRRDRDAGRPDRAAPDRQLEQPGAGRGCRRVRRGRGVGRQRAR